MQEVRATTGGTWQNGSDDGAHDREINDDRKDVHSAQLIDVYQPLDEDDGDQVKGCHHKERGPHRHKAGAALPLAPPVVQRSRSAHAYKYEATSPKNHVRPLAITLQIIDILERAI